VEAEEGKTTNSPNADTFLLFTKPLHSSGNQMELPGGHLVEFLIGFTNKGKDDFVIETVEASFRYPMDFNYHIQNFSAIAYNREVKPGHEATVSYSFLPSENFAGRPFGLNIALSYRDANGIQFSESVFNETISIIELDEGLDGETFFLYVFLAAIAILLLVLGQQFLGTMNKRKRSPAQRKTVETGTTNTGDIDYEWLPAETLKALRKNP
jgi:translocon-associated protein subunit alpha